MIKNAFTDEEIPYEVLNRFGLSQEMIEDLPQNVLSDIREGRRSPVLPISYTCEDGETVRTRARFSLERDEESGEVKLMFYPKLVTNSLDKYSEAEQQRLRSGAAIIGMMTTADGREVQAFHQMDKETQQVVSVPTPVIGNNLQVYAEQFNLTPAEVNCLKNGEPLTITEEDEQLTIGSDLSEAKGIRYCSGDALRWKQQSAQEMGAHTFGIFGCWVKDADGNLDYVPEEEYTESMWEAQKELGMSRASAFKM